ncbi:MAG: OmpH family outer membrane protein [Bacteroidales bacterium]|nr:OmpH family outer membrane protein [Bacteroidales bacterium]
MKKLILTLTLVSLLGVGYAQKYACVNTEYILTNIPDYAQAQGQLEKASTNWQKELEQKYQEIDKMYKAYQQEAYLLPDNLKRKREDDIIAKESEVKELQRKRFGAGGDLDKKREELMKPIQDKVYNAIERIANEKSYAFVLDKAGGSTLLFVNAKYDISDQVLDLLGYSSSSTPDSGEEAASAKTRRTSNPELNRPNK